MSERLEIDTAVGRLVVHTQGQGIPAVLWQSLFVDERSWDRVVPALAEGHRLVVITGPGHGQSSDPGRRYSLVDCSRAAAQVLDSLGITEPVDWVGNAWGGHVGVHFASSRAGHVHSLVTIGSPIQPLSRRERRRTRLLLAVHRLVGPTPFIVHAVVETLLSPATRDTDPEAVALVQESVIAADRRRLRNAVRSISLHREDLAALLSEVTAPTLMITGSEHAGWTPEQAQRAIGSVSRGRVAVVRDAAYLVPLEQPEAVAGLISDFWAQLRAEASGGAA
jgi:pimeloyl-ACP methyl ester carboxylesterase